MSSGYSLTRQKSETIASALCDAALLLGAPQPGPVELATGGTITPGLGLTSEADILLRRARDLQEGLFKVIVYGEFKHGKSTLLNAMLGSRLLAAKTLKCTAIISVLVYGEREDVAVYTAGSEQPLLMSRTDYLQRFQLTAEDEEKLNDQGYIDRFKDIAYAQIECRSPLCANGVRLVDSPGLGDHPSRTRVTTKYLRESHAIIFVLNAMRLLSDDEKYFIKTEFKPGRVRNVFFVVNRINQINQREVEEVRNYFRGFLAPYFTDERGQFDEALYRQRVFYINALDALEVRASSFGGNGTGDAEERLAATGVPALEQELERFLTSDQKHSAALSESAQCLQMFVDEALRTIEQQKALQTIPLERFEQTLDEVAQHMHMLDRRKQDIERTVRRFGEMIAQKIVANLRDYLHEMRDSWRHDAQNLNLNEISLGTTMTSFFQGFMDKEAAQQRIAAPIKREIEHYIQRKTREWTDERIPTHIKPDLDALVREIEEQVIEFKLELERTSMIIAPELVPHPQRDRERFSQWAQTLIADTLHDITGIEGAVSEWGNWGNVLWRVLQQLILVYIAISFSGPVGWTIFAVAQVVLLIWSEQQFKQSLLKKIGDELHQNLQQELPRMQREIYRDVSQQFNHLASNLNTTLQEQIDEKRWEMARIIAQKRDATFSVEQEKLRLEEIGRRLLALRDMALEAARE